MNDASLFESALTIALLILSTAFHEMAHAYSAHWLGDPTPGRYGRITLDPFPHLQPVITAIILPVIMFLSHSGFMILAQTPIDPSRFKKPLRDQALVAVAGPLTNVLCAFVLIGILWIPGVWVYDGPATVSMGALSMAAFYNFVLAVFNMVPIPPLDGYRIIRAILPFSIRRPCDDFARQGFSMILCMMVGSQLTGLYAPFLYFFTARLLPH